MHALEGVHLGSASKEGGCVSRGCILGMHPEGGGIRGMHPLEGCIWGVHQLEVHPLEAVHPLEGVPPGVHLGGCIHWGGGGASRGCIWGGGASGVHQQKTTVSSPY